MDLGGVKVVGGPLVLATDAGVDALEAKLGGTFPEGYRAYVTTLGEGVLGGTFVRVYPPWRIARELAPWRKRLKKYWFWDRGSAVLTKQRAVQSVIVADTLNGDELLFHPGERPAQEESSCQTMSWRCSRTIAGPIPRSSTPAAS
jgi:hypothetical protein